MSPITWGDVLLAFSVILTGVSSLLYVGRKFGAIETKLEGLTEIPEKVAKVESFMDEARNRFDRVERLVERRLNLRTSNG